MTKFIQMARPGEDNTEVEIYVNPALVRFVEPHSMLANLCWLHFDRQHGENDRDSIVCVKGDVKVIVARLEK